MKPLARHLVAVSIVLGGIAWGYAEVREFRFTNWDDDQYLLEPPGFDIVAAGLSPRGAALAWTSFAVSNWHPLTWHSYQFDHDALGLDPGAMHVENVLLHAVVSLLLYALLVRCGASWLPALAATAWFAWHPLRVESVAWLSERKDLLSAAWGLIAVHGYLSLAGRSSVIGRVGVATSLALSLLAKPMLVTLPLIFPLLDRWPLRRSDEGQSIRFWTRLVELTPYVLLAAISAGLTLAAQRGGGAVQSFETVPLDWRLANAARTLVIQLGQAAWPGELACVNPWPIDAGSSNTAERWFLLTGLAAAGLILALSVIVWRLRERFPAVATGWAWYLISFLPVLGLIQVGFQTRADRYTYWPSIGLAIIVSQLLSRPTIAHRAGIGCLLVLSVLLLGKSRDQAATWRTSETLFQHAVRIEPRSPIAWFNLGWFYDTRGDAGDRASAESAYRAALRLAPNHVKALNNLALLRRAAGDDAQARRLWEQALEHEPGFTAAWLNLAQMLAGPERLAALHRAAALGVDDARLDWLLAETLFALGNDRAVLERLARRDDEAWHALHDGGGVSLGPVVKRHRLAAEVAIAEPVAAGERLLAATSDPGGTPLVIDVLRLLDRRAPGTIAPRLLMRLLDTLPANDPRRIELEPWSERLGRADH